ncbi:MAG: branched-chain alpha-keto acid dehydrogenase subunit, partial [Desertimonas sp.]|nr:branched-chain alpha-keto acid dehydrogenase subunit [Desertimonas sp.]
MATYVVKLPDVGEGVAEAELVEWHVAVGDAVAEDQPIADVMTDKATVELPSPVGGTIAKLGAEAGDVVAIGSDLVWIETDGAETAQAGVEDRVTTSAEAVQAERTEPTTEPDTIQTVDDQPPPPETPSPAAPAPTAAPAVRRRAAELGIELATVGGSGPDGRIVHGDLDRLLA